MGASNVHLRIDLFRGKITYLVGLAREAPNIGRYGINLEQLVEWIGGYPGSG